MLIYDFKKSFLVKILLGLFFKTKLFNETQPFSKLALLLNNKLIIKKTSLLLHLLLNKKLNDIKVKTFLSIFMIIHHPKVIISNETIIEKEIISLANKLKDNLVKIYNSNNLSEFNFYMGLFNLRVNVYFKSFDKWKDLDKERILNDLCVVYFELDVEIHKRLQDNVSEIKNKNTINNDSLQKTSSFKKDEIKNKQTLNYDDTPIKSNLFNKNNNVFVDDLKREQKSLLKKIERMNGMDYFNKINKQKEDYQKQITNMYKNIGETLHKAFWDDVKAQLEKEPPNFLVIVNLLNDLKHIMMSCVPNRTDIHKDIDSHIDTELITGMIEKHCLNEGTILSIINFVFDYLKRFQSRSDDKKNKLWQDGINEKFVKGIKYADFFPVFFKEIFEKFETILKEVELLKSMSIYEQIKERVKELKK
tara:strand:+ start:123 stop:1379 length:1257 start_codon:yes stop_codon:yes gene_type:complete